MKKLTDILIESLDIDEARIGVKASVGKLKNFDGRALAIMTDYAMGVNCDVETNDGESVPEDQIEVVNDWMKKNCDIEVVDWEEDWDEELDDPDFFFKKTKLKKLSPFIFWTCKPYPGYSHMDEDYGFILKLRKPQSGANKVTCQEILDILKHDEESVRTVVDNITKAYTCTKH